MNFKMDNIGFNKEEALQEAKRCLSCKVPRCETGCPASLPIRDYIKLLKENKVDEAAEIIRQKSLLSNVCSIVCPHEKQCIGHCILNAKNNQINVGSLERYISENGIIDFSKKESIDYKVAVIGAGPAGISCAIELAKNGVDVTVYEKDKYIGGVMTYGIPQFRLDKKIVRNLEEELKKYDVKVVTNKYLTYNEIVDLKNTYDKVFISTGLPSAKKLGIPNEKANGVYDALELLRKTNEYVVFNEGFLPKLEGITCVIGAGNVAVDAARTALRLGSSEVYIVYRRTLEESPASKAELNEALSEGVKFKFLNNPVEVLVENEKVTGIKCEIMVLGEPDSSGRRKPMGSNEFVIINCDNVIQAIGQNPDENQNKTNHFKLDYGYFVTNENLETSVNGIYAGGDIVLGASTVVKAMTQGKMVANNILKMIK